MGEDNGKVDLKLEHAPMPKTPPIKFDPNKAQSAAHEKLIDLMLLQWSLIQKKVLSFPVVEKTVAQTKFIIAKIKIHKPQIGAIKQNINGKSIKETIQAQGKKVSDYIYAKLRARTLQALKIPVSDRTLKEIIQGEAERRTLRLKNFFQEKSQAVKLKLNMFYEKKKAELKDKIDKRN